MDFGWIPGELRTVPERGPSGLSRAVPTLAAPVGSHGAAGAPLPSPPVRQLFPLVPPPGPAEDRDGNEPARADPEVDPVALYAGDRRPPPPGRPWVMVNMVASLDGATMVDGVSGPLGGPADKEVFAAIRAVADVILVGAGTVRAEGYGPPRPSPTQRARRRARGQAAAPRLAVCSASLGLDPGAPLFAAAEERPVVITVSVVDDGRRAALGRVADLVVAGETRVDMSRAVAALGATGARVVLAEGGPSLNGQLVSAGLVDELCLTLSPLLAGGRSARIAVGDPPCRPVGLILDRLLEAHGMLFARYVRP